VSDSPLSTTDPRVAIGHQGRNLDVTITSRRRTILTVTILNSFFPLSLLSLELFSYFEILPNSYTSVTIVGLKAGAHHARCELTAFANPRSVFQKKERDRCKHSCNKANKCCGPLYAHLHVPHVRRLGEKYHHYTHICKHLRCE
jgi:hypothetical protein